MNDVSIAYGEAPTLHSQLAWVLGHPIQRNEGPRFWHLEGFCLFAFLPLYHPAHEGSRDEVMS